MTKILQFPSRDEDRERLAKIEADKCNAVIDAEIAEIHVRWTGIF